MSASSLLNVLVFCCFASLCFSLNHDGLSLLALKSAVESDPTRSFRSWSESDSTPCHWEGIACASGRVTALSLRNRGLSGYIPSELGLLDSLTRLDLAHNNFSQPIPSSLFKALHLGHLDLSHNSLSGQIPAEIISLKSLTHLDLSSNLLNGSLPDSLADLDSLAGTLNLSYNRFSGEIPASYGRFPVPVNLDLRHNNLTGSVPQVGSLLNQGPTAFDGNPGLCGFPLQTRCAEAEKPAVVRQSTQSPKNLQKPNPGTINDGGEKDKGRNGTVTVSLISGVSLVFAALSVSVWLIRKKWKSGEGKTHKEKNEAREFDEEAQEGKFVVMDEGFDLELEDLLRASAYVVGKGRSGIVYKVVAGSGKGRGPVPATGTVVAVRKLSESDVAWRLKDFEAELEAIGRVHHPNIVRLRAYYYAPDEKLVVTDFVRNGSLYSALHGGASSSLPPLSWAERLKIAQGTARGLMYIHEYSPKKYVHGNLKSNKILLDEELQPHISGFGLTRLISGTSNHVTCKHTPNPTIVSSAAMASRISPPSEAYLPPEARVPGAKLTQKRDVYSFGVVLLEILTGRLPGACPENDGRELASAVRSAFREERQLGEIIDPALIREVEAKKQVGAAFHIALNCTEHDAEVRPRMRTVSESLGRLRTV